MKQTNRILRAVGECVLALGNALRMNPVALAVMLFGLFASGVAHAQTFTGTDPSTFGTAAVTDIQQAYSYTIPILGTACVAAGIFIIYKWIRKAMGKS